MKIRYLSNGEESEVSLNSNYDVTLIDYVYFRKYLLNLEIKKLVSFISIREVNNKVINLDKYMIIIIYVIELINNVIKKTYLVIKVYIIKDLKINIFIDINIMTS